jgi:tetratricopeptide (TPR) repeat protein
MIGQLTRQHHGLSDETVATVVARTGGVPLFVEELTRAVLESGDDGTNRHIPATLHDSLMARLDRLGTAKEVAQIAAVIGREFSYELIHAVVPVPEGELQSGLARLAEADLVYAGGVPPEAAYTFKHWLIQKAAYEALLKSRRRDVHRRIAEVINEKFAALAQEHPETLARHWTEAGETELAIKEWSRAAKAAETRNAFHEAQESYQQALALINLLPESPERDSRELELRQSLVRMLQVTRGWAAPETVAAAARVGTLAEKGGNLTQLIRSLAQRCFHAYITGDLLAAGELADQAHELAIRDMNPTALGHVHLRQLLIRYQRGDLAGAEKYFTTGLKLFDDPYFRQNPNGGIIAVFGTASWNAWMLGRADVARDRGAKMMAAVNTSNPHDLPWAEFHAACLLYFLRESEQSAALAARVLDACEKHKLPNEAALGRGLLGIAQAHLGYAHEGIALIREGIAGLLKVGNRIGLTRYLNNLAQAQWLGGAITEALLTIEQALQFNPKERAQRPETLRLRGELHLENSQPSLAQADFRDSISLAQSMGAKAWELRTTMSLARLLASKGSRDEARTMLAGIYAWFTEGFDTPDLIDARALLDELSG